MRSRTQALATSAFLARLLLPFAAAAQVEDDEPSQLVQEVFQSELAYPQEQAELQITLIPSLSEGDADTRSIATLLEFGLTESWQVELEWDWLRRVDPGRGTATGVGDLSVGTALSWLNLGGSAFHLAASFEVGLPVGNPEDGLGEGSLEFEPALAAGVDLEGGAHLFLNVGVGLVSRVREGEEEGDKENEGDPPHELIWNVGAFMPVGPVRIVGELNVRDESWNRGGTEREVYLTPGLIIDLPGTLELGFGAPIGLGEDADDWRAIALFTYELDTR